jgi:hypothetical protein
MGVEVPRSISARWPLALAVAGATLFLGACRSESRSVQEGEAPTAAAPQSESVPRSPVSLAVDECTFETFVPGPGAVLSESSKSLMAQLGTAIANQPQGSLAKLACPQGEAFPAWVDSSGNAASALHGVSWLMTTPAFIPGESGDLALWEKRDGQWWQVGALDDVTVDASVYTLFSGDSPSEHSTRLLRHFGIAIAGRESTVRVRLGDRSGTANRDAEGNLQIIDDRDWNAPSD